jgi:CheY-like chemotaxis protein
MPKGGRLIITAENKELSPEDVAPHGTAPGQYIKLVVSDTGIGMDAETKMHLFEPSFRTDGENRGMMHGLFSVFNIVKNHLGFITFESEPGSGAVFRIYLPSFDPPRKNEALNNQPIKAGKGTILIVDDEKLILNCYSTLLAKIGYDVLTASNGKEAVEMMRRYKGKISVVVLDLIMPEMNGKEAYLEMREIMPSVKVLLSSGYNSDGQVEELLALGCNGFLQKPCNLAELSRKIQDIL